MVVVESCVGDSSVVCAKRKNLKLRGQRKHMNKKACENDRRLKEVSFFLFLISLSRYLIVFLPSLLFS